MGKKREWIERKLALYEKWKALEFKQEALNKERMVRQAEIHKEWKRLVEEQRQLIAEEPKEE